MSKFVKLRWKHPPGNTAGEEQESRSQSSFQPLTEKFWILLYNDRKSQNGGKINNKNPLNRENTKVFFFFFVKNAL